MFFPTYGLRRIKPIFSLESLTGTGDEHLFVFPGTYTWTAPEGVTSVNVVAVGGGGGGVHAGFNRGGGGAGGLGWKNNIPVVPGQSYTVVVGSGGISGPTSAMFSPPYWTSGTDSYFIDSSTVVGRGGTRGSESGSGGAGGGYVGDGGGNGGAGSSVSGNSNDAYGGGGGAGGYTGNGGVGGNDGSGGGGGGGLRQQHGGGVGLYGQGGNGTRSFTSGANNATSPTGGSGGGNGDPFDNLYYSQFGGGAGASFTSSDYRWPAGSGAVRIVWGNTISFPVNGKIVWLDPKLPFGLYNVPYSATINVGGGAVAPYRFAVVSGTLPPGLSLNINGTISGTPTWANGGRFKFTVAAIDSTGRIGAREYTLETSAAHILYGAGTYSWTVPEGVSKVSVIAVGGGGGGAVGPGANATGGGGGGGALAYTYNIPVTPGEVYTITAGAAGPGATGTFPSWDGTAGGDSSFRLGLTELVKAGGGGRGLQSSSGAVGGAGGQVLAGTGGAGGTGGTGGSFFGGGGGGAGGYSGPGGNGWTVRATTRGSPGQGGGGAGGKWEGRAFSDNGGGVGLYGEGQSGYAPGTSGSGGSNQFFGGGGAGFSNFGTSGGGGGVRVFWRLDDLLEISPTSLPNFEVDQPYTVTFTATGGTEPYIFSVVNGSLPSGLELSSSGILSGTPTVIGIYNFTIRVTDFAGNEIQQEYVLTYDSPDIDGGNSETTVDLSLGPDSTILVLGANTNDIPISFDAETNLVLGSNISTVSLEFSPADVNLIVSTVETPVPLALYPPPLEPGSTVYTTSGSYTWTAPSGVTSVSVVTVGGGGGGGAGPGQNQRGGGGGGGALAWKNNISVVPGQSYQVFVGGGGVGSSGAAGGAGGTSYFINTSTVAASGGGGGLPAAAGSSGGANGTLLAGDGGGVGGVGGQGDSQYGGGGGGAGGYAGAGGSGSAGPLGALPGSGSGGGGAGGSSSFYGGGVGLNGQGNSGSTTGAPGSGGVGPAYGGGGYGSDTLFSGVAGNTGAVRIIWGAGRSFPNNAS